MATVHHIILHNAPPPPPPCQTSPMAATAHTTNHNGNNKHLPCMTVVNSHTHLTPTTKTTTSACYVDSAWRRPPSPSAAFGNDNQPPQTGGPSDAGGNRPPNGNGGPSGGGGGGGSGSGGSGGGGRGGGNPGGGGGGGGGPPFSGNQFNPPAPYSNMPTTMKTELKVEQLPEWDGNHWTAIEYFWQVQQLACLGGWIPEALGYWLWFRLKDSSPVKRWFVTLPVSHQTYMRSHYLKFMKGLKDGYLGHRWQLKMNSYYNSQSFRKRNHKRESPSDFSV
ncbi:uncharacterized protein LACBIDRAFT_330431 [Laccaria bicolor S238N-H82]|uniref:Predicted protein n=1 Tax=Laccaria bicolor (strain S238N-H82 / ATCC MYA-4686) TaxID=486041 RepID=B0DLA2_LACBS|nr:uncharacterized protein LACBIDRAFT_330431 [Laccaria bicolor S238N-H82]EDR04528.1 predicted protein [Laccaria bicolor S238N-H82]|eukprot:XP_001884700.1 predicted protein [Laccaria bicolor S238N-H82]